MDRRPAIRTAGFTLGAILIAALAVLVLVQHRTLVQLREEKRVIQRNAVRLDRLSMEAEKTCAQPNQQTEIDRLREDNKDLLRLRNEVRQLREQAAEVEPLRAANALLLQAVQDKALPPNQRASVDAARKQGALLGIQIVPVRNNPESVIPPQKYQGAIVAGFLTNAPAAQSGLIPGDIIVRLDGRPVENAAQLQAEMLTKRPGDIVLLDVMRNDLMLQIPVQSQAWPQ